MDSALRQNPPLRRVSIGRGRGTIGTLFYRTTPSRPPRWLAFFGAHLDPRALLSSTVAAALIAKAGGRLFALAFGTGRHLLDPGSFEKDFGLRVTLNSVSPDRIRTIDRVALDATGRHSREQASRTIPIIEFGLDIDKDILRAVTGPPEDPSLGIRLAGADALAVIAETTLAGLPSRLEAYLDQFRKRAYRTTFPWVDNIREVADRALRAELDTALEERIRRRNLDRVWMAVPDLVDWHDVSGFSFSRSERAERLDDIGFEPYLHYVRHPDTVDIATLRRHRVHYISADTDEAKAEWSVYECIYAEIDRNQRTYLLNGGRWYEVARNYVREVDAAIGRIKSSTTLGLPRFTDHNEADYNRRVWNSNKTAFALMDRKMIRYGGGSSQIEFCDLYTNRKQMVHVKRYGGSGTLSHLFAQGSVSANLFLNDQRFRTAVNTQLPASHKLPSVTTPLKSSEYEVAYVVASKAAGPLTLPFFSRVTLRSSSTQLGNMGFQVTLTKVDCP